MVLTLERGRSRATTARYRSLESLAFLVKVMVW
jgi:hypothetical protein